MAKSKVMHGARAVLYFNNVPCGIFNSVSYQVGYDVVPAHLLGRYSAAELVYVGAEPVSISASGFRVLDAGPLGGAGVAMGGQATALVPKIQDLDNYEDLTVQLMDRVTNRPIMKVEQVKSSGFSSSVSARALQELTVNMQGLTYSDEEEVDSVEPAGASSLPVVPAT